MKQIPLAPYYTIAQLKEILHFKTSRGVRSFMEKLGIKATLLGERKYIYFFSTIQNHCPELFCSILEINGLLATQTTSSIDDLPPDHYSANQFKS